ncbi:Pentatricopeptide repeat-containing protein At3g24000, mitochondrial [Linum perenne]
MLKKCTLLGKLEEGKIVHTHLLNSHFSRDSVLLTTLINLYSKCGSLDDARQLFDEMPDKRDIVAWTALIAGFSQCERMEEAQVIFHGLVSRNDVSWNTLIAAHARKGEAEHAFHLFSNMLRENVQPTQFTYSSILNACAVVGSLEQGKWVHAILIKSQAKLVGFVGNTLLDMYAKSGSLEEAKKVFDRLLRRDVVSWNTLLKGYAQHGLGKTALRTLEKMLKIGIAPNDITFLCVLTACSHAGLVDEGFSIFSKMKKYDIEPDVSHYVTIVDLYGRAGQLELAEKSIREMPIEPTAAVWGALLGACRMHKKTELGIYAAERIFELDPHDSGPHMLLYNIYASAGRWAEATKVRKIMKESGVKKEPACSWVEIENEVHVFVADDDSHPDSEEIHAMWENTRLKIKQIGYKPDANHVLLCLDQREREVKLQHHSEKLALAFALLKTPPRSTIRIKKNIRVCGDCHSAFKLVSKVVNREIIVRDTNRFHHFREGSCSCRDYW